MTAAVAAGTDARQGLFRLRSRAVTARERGSSVSARAWSGDPAQLLELARRITPADVAAALSEAPEASRDRAGVRDVAQLLFALRAGDVFADVRVDVLHRLDPYLCGQVLDGLLIDLRRARGAVVSDTLAALTASGPPAITCAQLAAAVVELVGDRRG